MGRGGIGKMTINSEAIELAVDFFILSIQNEIKPDFNDCLLRSLRIQTCNGCKFHKTCMMWGEPDLEMCGYEREI